MKCSNCSQPAVANPQGGFYKLCAKHIRYDRDRARRWRKDNPDKAKETTERYLSKLSTDQRKAMYAGIARRWKQNHPDRNAFNSRQYEYRRYGAPGKTTQMQLKARIDFYGRCCYLCGCDWDALPKDQKTIDHVIPLISGGTNWPANQRPACRTCNSAKKDKSLKEYTHPVTRERVEGLPGETLMQHLTQTTNLSTPEVWQLIDEAGKI